MLAALVALLWVGLTSAPARAANPAADIEQCRNGTFSSPQQCVGSAWQTGNAGASNSHYREGDSVPFRAKLINLSTSGSHTLVIQYDTIDNGAHAYDYLISYNRTETTADPCLGISPCVADASGAIPADGSIIFANPSSTQVPGSISIWNGSITSVAYGSSDPADKRSVIVTFTATNSTVVLAWGGHIASQIDWGAGNGASAISGSPYHMRLLDLDNDGLGNMDRSLSAASVAPVPANFTTQASAASITLGQSVTDLATLAGPNGTVSGTVSFFVCGPALVSNPDCTSGGSAVGSAVAMSQGSATSASFTPTAPGRYCFRAQYTPDLFAQYSPGHHTNLTTECFGVIQPMGTLRVIKSVVNDNGGTQGAADFMLHVKKDGSDVLGSPAAGSASGVVYTLPTGSYTVSEDAPPSGYAQTGISGDCDAGGVVAVAAGAQKTCTITNADKAANLIVIKHVINDDGGAAAAADFPIAVTGNNPSPASFSGAEAPGTQVAIGAGSFGVTETENAGYAASYAGCSGSIALGETKTCTITNNDKAAKLLVKKIVVNDNGGTKFAADFSISVTGNNPSPTTFPGSAAGTDVAIQPGAFSVTETEDPGYAATYSGCTGSIALGETKTCEITNNDKAATLIVTKTVINDEGGTKVAADFSISVTGNSPSPATFPGSAAGTDVAIQPVSYSVNEAAAAGYTTSYSAGCTGTIALGETKNCTVTNNDNIAPSVLVEKTASPTQLAEPGGSVTFSVKVVNQSQEAVTLTTLVDDVYGNLDNKGTCDVPQTLAASDGAVGGPDEYTCSFTANVSGNAGSSHRDVVTATVVDDDQDSASDDDDATVTVTNVPSSIVVTKTADPTSLAEPGGNVTFTVKVENTSAVDSVTINSLVDDVYGNLDGKGTCDVLQTLVAGASYSCSFSGAVSGNAGSSHKDVVTASGTDDDGNPVANDDDATVSISNVASSIVVTKTASPTSIQEPGGQATFSVKIDNTSAVDSVTISSLVDDVYGSLDGKGDCDVPRTIAAGDSYSCSFAANLSGAAGSTHRDVVTASGSDDDGNPVAGQDDATVAITAGPTLPPPPPTPPAPAPPAPAIDLSITKTDRPDPVFVGASLTYTLSVRNAGPDTATNVTVADSLPAATRFVSVQSSQGVCTGGPVIRCSLGTLPRDGSATVTIVVRPLEPGALINSATVVGSEPEANTSNNSASTPTLVRGPFVPPTPATCPTLTVETRSLSAGRKGIVRAVVSSRGKAVRGVRVLMTGAGIRKAGMTDGRGRVAITVRPPRAGIVEIRMTNQPGRCSTRRIGVVGVFQPPSLTG